MQHLLIWFHVNGLVVNTKKTKKMSYAFFWVISWHLNFICRHLETHCLFHLHRQVVACRMNSAGDMFGVLYGKKFSLEMA